MAFIEKSHYFYTPAGVALANAKVSVYFTGTSTAARVFDANQNLKDTAPQLVTDSTGYVKLYLDDDDFQAGQAFDLVAAPDARCNPTENEVRLTSVTLTTNWSEIADDNGHKPEDDADVTANQFTQSLGDIDSTVVNFDARNDRDATAITVPTIATDGTAIDHTVNTDGSADISFEWTWSGTESDIDGFVVYLRGSTSSVSYDFGTTPSEEFTFYCRPDRRHFILKGVAANLYWTFGVSAYRIVDPDVDSSGVIATAVIQPSIAEEDPYHPSTTVAFAGNITGTVNDQSVSSVVYHDGSVIKRTDGTGINADTLPESTTRKWAGESGADVTADNPQPADWLSSLIDTLHIADDAIIAAKLAVAGIDGTTGDVAANHIVANMLQAGCVTAEKINVATLAAISADMGTITAGSMTGAVIKTSNGSDRVELDASNNKVNIIQESTLIANFGGTGDGNIIYIDQPDTSVNYPPVWIRSAQSSNIVRIIGTHDGINYPSVTIEANPNNNNLYIPADYSSNSSYPAIYVTNTGYSGADCIYAENTRTTNNPHVIRAKTNATSGVMNAVVYIDVPSGGPYFIYTTAGAYCSNSGVWTNASSKELKENFAPREVLDLIKNLPIFEYNYKTSKPWNEQRLREHHTRVVKERKFTKGHKEGGCAKIPSEKLINITLTAKEEAEVENAVQETLKSQATKKRPKHFTPVAEDFWQAFGIGEDDKSLSAADLAGVALQGIKDIIIRLEKKGIFL